MGFSSLDIQVGGDHYKKYKIQPFEFFIANNIGHAEGEVICKVMRFREKGGIEDLKKAIHHIEMLMEYNYKEEYFAWKQQR